MDFNNHTNSANANRRGLLSQKLACAYFFVMPALAFGILTSRLPALKLLVGADDRQIGLMLLTLGCSTLAGLIACNRLINRYSARIVAAFAAIMLALAITAAAFAANFWQMTAFCLLAGLGVGLCDVGINALGIFLEQHNNIFCLSFLHACSSIGGVAGSLSGSLFAKLQISPFLNFVIILGVWLLLWPIAFKRAPQDSLPEGETSRYSIWAGISVFVCLCGVLNLLCHVAEGSAGEWGSVLLHSVKGASQEEAALVFAFFTGAMVVCRLTTDHLRRRISDFSLTFYASLLGGAGMALVLLSSWPSLCLAGYALMGGGLAPVAPILFSRAGASRGVSPGQASAVVSIFAYAGLLFFPPFLGMLGKAWGIERSLWVIVCLCIALALGCVILRGKNGRKV